jgi:DNA-binding NarL/FixJ family response regulator
VTEGKCPNCGQDTKVKRKYADTRALYHCTNCRTDYLDAYSFKVLKNMKPLITLREEQMLSLAALGKTNKEIGFLTEISEQTVKNHFASIYLKLQVSDRAQAVYKFFVELEGIVPFVPTRSRME